MSSWAQVAALSSIRLNFGGGADKHPRTNFDGYVAVEGQNAAGTMGASCSDAFPWCGAHCVCYDEARPIPLANDTVAHILSEHCFEHIPEAKLPGILDEFHRVLKPGGWARVAVPDYGNPRQAPLMEEGLRLGAPDRTNPRHVTFTNYAMIAKLAYASRFEGAVFYEFHDNLPGRGGDAGTPKHVVHALNFDKGRTCSVGG